MKNIRLTVFICAILVGSTGITIAQKLSFGEYTGINFSWLHGNLNSTRWAAQPGSTAGFLVEYSLGRSFSVQSEVGFISQYYKMKSYSNLTNILVYQPVTHNSMSSMSPITSPNINMDKMDFSYLRFPLIVKWETPTRLQLGIGGGVFYSVLMNDDFTREERDAAQTEGRGVYPPTHDWGYLLSADLSYPVTKDIRLCLTGRLSSGQKVVMENYKGKNGANEILIGIKYIPWAKNKSTFGAMKKSAPDTIPERCYIKPELGLTLSWNSAKEKLGNYSEIIGSSAGLIVGYRLDQTVSLQSGFRFHQKGYALSDSSIMFHRYLSDDAWPGKKMDTQVNLDYLTIPLNFNLSFGKSLTFYLDFGLYADFLLNASCTGTVINESFAGYSYMLEKQNLNEAVDAYYKSADFGYATGFGLQFPILKKMKIDLGIQYSKGFKNILKEPEKNQFNGYKNDISFQNSSVLLQFGIQIPIPN